MKILCLTNSFSIECGEDDGYYQKGEEFISRLLFACESLTPIAPVSNYSICHDSLTQVTLSGKVLFKGEYLLVIESVIRFSIVLNNEFRFGNYHYVGNREIDHTEIQVGDYIMATGYFNFIDMPLCVFTYLPDENAIPHTGYRWRVVNFYRVGFNDDDTWYRRDLSEFPPLDRIDTSLQDIDDKYLTEFELMDVIPQPHSRCVRVMGHIEAACWLGESTWIINCQGVINGRTEKIGKWVYYDKTGQHKSVIDYGNCADTIAIE